jgi:predicted CXXCH cytochrome family protein
MPTRAARALAILFVAWAAPCWIGTGAHGAEASGPGPVPLPAVPKAQGERCVADTDFMRRNHMTVLKHQRDDTVHLGLRREQFSLEHCLSCHAVAGADGAPVAYTDARHFCRSCHDYAAVTIDCFECHASRAQAKPRAVLELSIEEKRGDLVEYLRENAR